MKVRVIKNAFYNLAYLEEGKIIDFEGDKLPSWAERAEKENSEDTTKADKIEQEQPDDDKDDEASSTAQEYLNRLIDEGIEKNILIEDSDKKTVRQQIEELEKALGRNK